MTAADIQALFLGGHPALDFLNTAFTPHETPVELIGDGPALLRWLVEAGHLDEATAARLKRRFDSATLEAAASDARKLRNWASRWLEHWTAAPNSEYGAEWRRLNAILARANLYREAVPAAGGWTLRERARMESADELLAQVALPIAQLVANESPTLVRRCAGPGCTLWFLDRTKAHRRMFCSPAACGNRAKVAAFRQRQRT